jgi:hypothetical protein
MLRFLCPPRWNGNRITRREWLRIGGLAGVGGAAALPSKSLANPSVAHSMEQGKARSVIIIYASGGQSQLETWDPKPDAPEEIRGEFRSIPSAVPGVRVCEHMPLVAKTANLFTIVRSVTHQDVDHGSATYLSLTGDYHAKRSGNPPVDLANDLPTFGAVLHRVRPNKVFPFTAAHINGPLLVPELP